MVEIQNSDDERIAAYRDIRERDLVGRQSRFIAEGKLVLAALLDSPDHMTESVLVLKRRLDAIGRIMAARPDVPVYAVDEHVMESIAGFDVHRGILAVGRRPAMPTAADIIARLPRRAMAIICVGISNHDNIGSIFRNAAAFGAGAVLLDATCCDPLYRKALRVSMGGVLKVPFCRFDAFAETHRCLSEAGFDQLALSPAGAIDIVDVRPSDRMALYLGSEGDGLPARILETVQTARIAISPGFDSLNVAAASAIALHRLAAGR